MALSAATAARTMMPLFRRSCSFTGELPQPFGVGGLHLQGQDRHARHRAHLVQEISGLGRGQAAFEGRHLLFQVLLTVQPLFELGKHIGPVAFRYSATWISISSSI